MSLGERLRQRLSVRNLSQSELARRVGVRQSTIYALIAGDSRGSKHLHSIARELGTTPAYLLGEVDDPDQGAPDEPSLSREQTEWLALFDALDAPDRVALTQVARSMRKGGEVANLHPSSAGPSETAIPAPASSEPGSYTAFTLPVFFPPEYALTRMFEALLAMVDRAAPAEAQARSLAQNLPIGLSQLRDLLPPFVADGRDTTQSDQPKSLVEQR